MADLTLANIIKEWLTKEQFNKDFSVHFPNNGDTIAVGTEGWVLYDHNHQGFSTVVTICHTNVYVEADRTSLEASDPEFFKKLEAALVSVLMIHAHCNHVRAIND